MATRSGIATQWGFKAESTWATPVVVDKFLPILGFTPPSNLVERLESAGIIAGRLVMTSQQHAIGRKPCAYGIETELYDRDIATLISHIMGDASSAYTPGDLYGFGLTVQVGVPDVSGTVQPFTYSGSKIVGAALGCGVGEIARLGLDLVAKREILYRTAADGVSNTDTSYTSATAAFTDADVGKPISGTNIAAATTIASVTSGTVVVLSAATTGTGTGLTFVVGVALASASYTSGLRPITFRHGSVTVGGSSVPVKKCALKVTNKMETERFFLGQDTISEPIDNDRRDYTLELDVEFTDLTQYRRYLNATEHAVVLTFTAAGGFSMVITTNVRLDGGAPQVSGRGLVMQTIPMKCIASGADTTAVSIALTEAS